MLEFLGGYCADDDSDCDGATFSTQHLDRILTLGQKALLVMLFPAIATTLRMDVPAMGLCPNLQGLTEQLTRLWLLPSRNWRIQRSPRFRSTTASV